MVEGQAIATPPGTDECLMQQPPLLIRGARLGMDTFLSDLRVAQGRIVQRGPALAPLRGECVIEAHGSTLLPGLRDHHLHLWSFAASLASVDCGPPAVHTAAALRHALAAADAKLASGQWLRGVGYHASVAGEIDRDTLDLWVPSRPVRIQHRSGRLWILNTAALNALGGLHRDGLPAGLERSPDGRLTGRLYDADSWMRERLGVQRPDLAAASRHLARWGIVGLTDTSHDNGWVQVHEFTMAQQCGELLQDLLLMGRAELDEARVAQEEHGRVEVGAHKFHLHEHDLPVFDDVVAAIRRSHGARRGCAFHCVTRTDLAFALAALDAAGTTSVADRIEHASVAPDEFVEWMARRQLTVVTQPGFVQSRGDAYLEEVDPADRPLLYRLRSLLHHGVTLAGSSDAPYSDSNPWLAMAAAVKRRTAKGQLLGPAESLTPEEALRLFTSRLQAPGRQWPTLAPGEVADLCLLDRPWSTAREDLAAVRPRAVLIGGRVVFQEHN
jgi:predicted amidohydrolase YtcJ